MNFGDQGAISHNNSVAYERVTKKFYDASGTRVEESSESEVMFESTPISGTAEVIGCSMGRTINMGNYESVSFSVFRSIPFHPSNENADKAFEMCKNWVGTRLTETVKKVVDYRDKKNGVQPAQKSQGKQVTAVDYGE